MKLFSSLIEPLSYIEPVTFPEMENIRVIPYIRNRLVFADCVARALRREGYEHVMIDFPTFMNDPEWLRLPLQLFPLISLAAFRRRDGELRAIAFTPNDAACLAAYWAVEKSIPFRCLDDSDMLNYPKKAVFTPLVQTGDDYRVFQQGLQGFFQALWSQMDNEWSRTTVEQQFFTKLRAGKVISCLAEATRFKRNILFVCEYQLWWAVQKVLKEGDSGKGQFIFKWQEAPGVLISEDPYFAWIYGLLDDFPAVNLEFWHGLKNTEGAPFDKLKVLENRIENALTGPSKDHHDFPIVASIQDLMAFQGYLKKLIVSQQRFLPKAGDQLFHAAEACGREKLLKVLAEELLAYPDSPNREQVKLLIHSAESINWGGPGLEVPDYDRLPFFFTGRPFSNLDDQGMDPFQDSELEVRKKVVDRIHGKMTRAEGKRLSESSDHTGVRWEIKADYRLHAQACALARFLVQLDRKRFVPKKSWGTLEDGIDWKATLASLGRGESFIYVKHRSHTQLVNGNGDEFIPVVFLFSDKKEIDQSYSYSVHDSNLAQRNIDLENKTFPFQRHPKPDKVYSLFATAKGIEYLMEHHIQRENLTSLALLCTKSIMGLERYQAISCRQPKFQCRIHPNGDPELQYFPKSERGAAWAVKYASDQVIVVAGKGWKGSAELANYAKRRGIKIQTVSLSAYRPEFIRRLSRCYFLSTPLKKHPQREQIVRRFVE